MGSVLKLAETEFVLVNFGERVPDDYLEYHGLLEIFKFNGLALGLGCMPSSIRPKTVLNCFEPTPSYIIAKSASSF